MRFSVIIPAYNSEKTLARCLESILLQTFNDFEIIIINDGSEDNTRSIINSYSLKDSRIRGIHKENQGVSSARNTGIKNANGEFIVFADADDIVEPEWLESFNIDKNTDLCVQGMKVIHSDKIELLKIKTEEKIEGTPKIAETLISNNLLGYSPTKRFKLHILKKYNILFDTTIHYREDDLFVLNYIEHIKDLKCLNHAHYIYYAPTESKTYKSSEGDCTEKYFQAIERIFNNKIPENVLLYSTWSIKPQVLRLLLQNKTPSVYLLYLYKRYIKPFSSDYKSKIIDFLIINSRNYPAIVLWIIKIIHNLRTLG